jgi:hypothetical protein
VFTAAIAKGKGPSPKGAPLTLAPPTGPQARRAMSAASRVGRLGRVELPLEVGKNHAIRVVKRVCIGRRSSLRRSRMQMAGAHRAGADNAHLANRLVNEIKTGGEEAGPIRQNMATRG